MDTRTSKGVIGNTTAQSSACSAKRPAPCPAAGVFLGAALCWAPCANAAGPGAEPGWRTYSVYRPSVERHDVINAHAHPNRYNHCSAIVWFDGLWRCFWGSNTHPDEHAPGQRLFFSVSRDARAWSAPEPLFSNATHCANPIRYPAGKGHQWQPNLGVVEGELWLLWNQGGSARDFTRPHRAAADDLRGLYFSRLRPGAKWVSRRLSWAERARPIVDGTEFQVASTQNLYRLRSGRVLAPVTLYSSERAPDAPSDVRDWWASTKRNGVVYTDDLGATWTLAPGRPPPGATWVEWEPTVWEQPDGSVAMCARNNRNWSLGHAKIPSSEYLLWSVSRDQGITWTPHLPVPIETVCSRMHAAPADGRGVWTDTHPGDDFVGRRILMVHNDAPGSLLPWAAARRNLALFSRRGAGAEFVAGNNVSGFEPEVAYPQMWAHDGALAISYTQGNSSPRSIRVALVRPMPDPGTHYLFPRSNAVIPPPRPRRLGALWSFSGGERIATRTPVDSGEGGFSFGAWILVRGAGALFDTRTEGGAPGGFSLMLGARDDAPPASPRPLYLLACLRTRPHVFGPALPVRRYAAWHYVGLTVRRTRGEAVFYVDNASETVRFDPYPPPAARGTTAHIGFRRPANSRVPGFNGNIRFLALYPGGDLGPREHAWLHNRFARELGRDPRPDPLEPAAQPALWLDAADQNGFDRQFVLPAADAQGAVECVTVDRRESLRFAGENSAGVDLDENHRARGDRVTLRAEFRVERGDSNSQTLCTVGDAKHPARLVIRAGQVYLRAGPGEDIPCGQCRPDGWTPFEVESAGNKTRARVGNAPWADADHCPTGTWMYLGEGYPTYDDTAALERRFLIDVGSVRTRVVIPGG